MEKKQPGVLYPLDMEAIALRLEAGELPEDVAASLPAPMHKASLIRRYCKYRGHPYSRAYPLSVEQVATAIRDADAGIPYSIIAAPYGVYSGTIERLHKHGPPYATWRYVPKPPQPVPQKALEQYQKYRNGVPTRERNNRRIPRARVVSLGTKQQGVLITKGIENVAPVPAPALPEAPAREDTRLRPLPQKFVWIAPLVTPEPPQRNVITLNAGMARHAVKDLQALGWRAEDISMSSSCSIIEVRDFSQKHVPLVATLRTMRDVLRFEGINLPCPRRGAPLPAGIKPGALPFSKNRRARDEPGHFPPQASLGTGLGRITGDIDY